MGVLDRLRRLIGGREPSPDGTGKRKPAAPPDTLKVKEARRLVDAYLKEAVPALAGEWKSKPGAFETGRVILDSDRGLQAVVTRVVASYFVEANNDFHGRGVYTFRSECHARLLATRVLLQQLLRRKLPFDEYDLSHVVDCVLKIRTPFVWDTPVGTILGAVERYVKENGVTGAIKARLKRLKRYFRKWSDYAERRKQIERIDAILDGVKPPSIEPGDAWADQALADLAKLPPEQRARWDELIARAATARSSKPSGKWLRAGRALVDEVGPEEFISRVRSWFTMVGKPGSRRRGRPLEWQPDPTLILSETNADILKGLVWCCAEIDEVGLCRSVGDLAGACFKKVPNHGPRSVKVGNACLVTLAAMPGMEGAAQLSRLRLRVKHPSARKQLEKALGAAARRAGLSADELEEMAAPTFGMQEVGLRRQPFGDRAALLRVVDSSTELRWLKPDGKEQKSVPKEVRHSFPDELKALKKESKDIRQMLLAQRTRTERTYLQQRSWDLESWRRHYLDHPLVGTLARRLIWHFAKGERKALGVWLDGRLADVDDRPLEWIDGETRVSLWHPMGFDVDEVVAWRNWLERRQVQQPFKQAHREIYVLTDAELGTRVYSNRFASHIIKQHQFAELCHQRGWKYALQGAWDSHNVPTLSLPQWDLSVEFWVDPAEGAENGDTSGAGVYLTVTTEQVRFLDPRGELVSLADVPAVVFSEIMRDVDLFVAVCSIGNDPDWLDRGPEGTYWHTFSFGELSAMADTRREVLERLVPRLKIADRCSFTGKLLVVRGALRTYKIHLGSANILMEPNDQYLCIVRGRGTALKTKGSQKIFLPFEGDGTLSLILSKAFLLADDASITDPTITGQIRRGN